MIKFDLNIKQDVYEKYKGVLEEITNEFNTYGKMSDWSNISKSITESELTNIKEVGDYVINNADVFIVVGIGGSYLGSKALIEALSNQNKPEIIFLGNTLSSATLINTINYIKDKRVVIDVISKSGSTLETNIVFDILLDEMKKKYDKFELSKRIIITTDATNSTLLKMVEELKCKMFNVPQNIGGRFSVLTTVGLLPSYIAGINIEELLKGAEDAIKNIEDSYKYALIRNICYQNGKYIEAFTTYQDKLEYFNEWLKQLFAESEGKNKKGILPISIINTRDLHSLGQYLQDGKEIIFETIIYAHEESISIDKYNKTLDEINYIAMRSVKESHNHMVNNVIELDSINEYNVGYLIYFFENSCMLSAYLLGVPYYNQDGVNAYKNILIDKLNNKL